MQVTPSSADAMDGIIAANPSEQMEIERIRILISPNNTAIALNARSLKPHCRGGNNECLCFRRRCSPMPNTRAQNVECLLRYFWKFLRLRRRQAKNNAVSFQANLLGRQVYPMLAYAQVAADIGIHRGNLVVSGTMKGCDLP